MPKLIVIGAGISGLSTGVHAQRCGFDVQIVEHTTAPGGVCTAWKHGDYTIDGCIHWLMGARQDDSWHRFYQEIGALDGIELQRLDHFVQVIDEVSGDVVTFDRDLDGLLRQVETISPIDLPLFRDLVELARSAEKLPVPPSPLPGLRNAWANLLELWHSREGMMMMLSHGEPMARLLERIQHPGLRYALSRVLPESMPVFFAGFLLGALANGDLATVVGGSLRFSEAIARRFEQLGGRIRYHADVVEILVENDRAVGVKLLDGEELRADHVVSTAPGPTTIYRMLGGRYTDRGIRERHATWPIFKGVCLVSFGLRKQWRERPHMLQLRLAEPFQAGPNRIDAIGVRNMAYDATLAPPGCSVIQVIHESDFDFWHDVHHAPARYHELKHQLAADLRHRLERWYPGFADAEEFVDIATPYTFWRYARSYRGAYEGWMPTTETMHTRISKTLPGLERFHMAGQWVEPGGGIPPAVLSGRQVVQLVCAEHDMPWVDAT
jgi:phytoene dehydrogenase-like protein